MSSPSRVSDETHSQDSLHASSQFVAGTALSDTMSLVHHVGQLPGGSSTVMSRAPNVAYSRVMAAARARSTSPRLRRSQSPLGLSVAQRCARLAEQTALTAIFGVGRVEAETHCVHEMVEATKAEAKSVRGEVESHVATLVAAGDASAAHATKEIASRVKEVVE